MSCTQGCSFFTTVNCVHRRSPRRGNRRHVIAVVDRTAGTRLNHARMDHRGSDLGHCCMREAPSVPADVPKAGRRPETPIASVKGWQAALRAPDRRLEDRAAPPAAGSFHHAADQSLVGKPVLLLKATAAASTATKSQKVWNHQVPGAWLTHKIVMARTPSCPPTSAKTCSASSGLGTSRERVRRRSGRDPHRSRNPRDALLRNARRRRSPSWWSRLLPAPARHTAAPQAVARASTNFALCHRLPDQHAGRRRIAKRIARDYPNRVPFALPLVARMKSTQARNIPLDDSSKELPDADALLSRPRPSGADPTSASPSTCCSWIEAWQLAWKDFRICSGRWLDGSMLIGDRADSRGDDRRAPLPETSPRPLTVRLPTSCLRAPSLARSCWTCPPYRRLHDSPQLVADVLRLRLGSFAGPGRRAV